MFSNIVKAATVAAIAVTAMTSTVSAHGMTPGFEKGDKTNLQPGGKPYKGPKTNIKEFINRYKSRNL